jgi:hypothetical protein
MPTITTLDTKAEVVRGSPVTVHGTQLPLELQNIDIQLGEHKIGHPSFLAKDRTSFVFVIPEFRGTTSA